MSAQPLRARRLEAHDATLPTDALATGTSRQILEAGLQLFSEVGFHGASIRHIAEAAGVGSATLYDHFPSKEHLLAELIRIGHDSHNRRVRQALLDAGTDPRDQLTALVRAHVRSHAEHSLLAVVCNSELHALGPAMAAPALAQRHQSEQLLLEIIERGIGRGVFEVRDAWLAAAAIGGMGIRVANWFRADGPYSVDEAADDYATFALRLMNAKATDQ